MVHNLRLRGRAREQEAIGALLAAASSGDGGALLLRGDPGTGKSALLEFAGVSARTAGFTVLGSGGLDAERRTRYAALHRLLQPLLPRLAALPPRHARVLTRAIEGARCPGEEALRVCVAALALLAAGAAERPLLCRVDDAHRIDPASLRVLAFTARRLGGQRVALVLTAAEPAPAVDALAGVPCLTLDPLDPRACHELLGDLLPGGLGASTATALAALAHGNPLGLTELARSLTRDQREGTAPPPTALPADSRLRRAYAASIARLPARTRWLLLLAAADAELRGAELVRAATASGVDVAALAPAERRGLVRVGDAGIVFPRPLLRTVVYEQAPLAQRRAAHLTIARTLDSRACRLRRAVQLAAAVPGPDAGLAGELAAAAEGARYATAAAALERAAELTADPTTAAARLVTAADYTWRAGSPYRARALLRQLRPGTACPAVRGRTRLLTGEIELRSGAVSVAWSALLDAADLLADQRRDLAVDALIRAGEAVCFSGDHYRYAHVAERAAALRRAEEPPATELMLAYIAGFAATFRGRHEAASGPLRRVVEIAASGADPTALSWASAACLLLADDRRAHRTAVRAVEAARTAGDLSVLPRALELQACAEYWLGRYPAATRTSLEGVRAAGASGQPNCAGNHLAMLAVLAALRGDRPACLRWLRRVPASPGARQVHRPEALSRWARALLDAASGRSGDAVARLTSIASPATGRGHLVVQVMATPCLIEAGTAGGVRPSGFDARAALAVFDRWAASTRDPARRALSERCHALLALPGSGEAEEHFAAALRLHRAADSEFECARTELLYGQQLRRHRSPRRARDHLHRALETFRRFDAPALAEQAAAELRAAGAAADVRATGAGAGAPSAGGTAEPRSAGAAIGMAAGPAVGALTAQQLRIARMVVDGATNREVAQRLLLSPRTVDHHLRNIFSRLGVRSRVELARRIT